MEENATKIRHKPVSSLLKWLINPFEYIAGWPSVGIGFVVLCVTSVIAWSGSGHFDGVLDFHGGKQGPLWFALLEVIINWLALSLLLYFAGLFVAKSRPRAVDIFGTQAVARTPSLGVALLSLSPPFQQMTLQAEKFTQGVMPRLGMGGIVVLVGIALFTVWMVMLQYRAYCTSCNLKGTKAALTFIPVLILAEILSKVLIVRLAIYTTF